MHINPIEEDIPPTCSTKTYCIVIIIMFVSPSQTMHYIKGICAPTLPCLCIALSPQNGKPANLEAEKLHQLWKCSDRMSRQTLKVQITWNLPHEKQTLDIFVDLCSLNTFTDMLGLFADSHRKDCEGRHVHQAAVWLLYDIHHFVCILWWPWPPLTARQLRVMLYSISDNPHRHNTFKNTWPV